MRRNIVTNHRYLIALTVTVTTGCPIGWDTIGGMDDEVGGTDTSGDGDGDGDTTTTDDTTTDDTTTDDTTTDDTTTDDTTTDDTTTDDTTTGDAVPPEQPQNLALSYEQVKQFQFTWTAAAQAETYQLLERANPNADYVPVGLPTASTETSLTVPLYMRVNASYIVQACNDFGCTDSEAVDVMGTLETAIGYFKASNTGPYDHFCFVALSGDGSTLAVGALLEDSNATGIGGDQADNSAPSAGAVYVFVRDPQGAWSQQAYIKASNTDGGDFFGIAVALSGDGSTLAVGAYDEGSNATGINGDESNESAENAGAAYVFVREQGAWSQQAYVKASNSGSGDQFGHSIALSGDGNTLAVGADGEASSATGIDGNQADESAQWAGAAYVFVREQGAWSQQAYVKASNTDAGDNFASSLALSEAGDTLAVGAFGEDSNATGIDGNQADNSLPHAGAVYVFVRDGQGAWSQQAYVKASNTDGGDLFGESIALGGDGSTLAVGAPWEDSNATGINGDESNDSVSNAGAVYMFVREQGAWSQQAYVKASINDAAMDNEFGTSIVLSGDGNTLAAGAFKESSGATGIDGNQFDNSAFAAGAAYVFVREQGAWSQQAYVKASNTSVQDYFGANSLALSGDGATLAVGAITEDSNATGVGGDQADNSVNDAGAVYLY